MRRRYLALEIETARMVESREFIDTVWSAITKLYGEYGASKTGLTLINYEVEKRFAVVRILHSAVVMVRAALASITRIGDEPATVHVTRVSGTLKALYEKTSKIADSVS
jgi:RNase P/RNase MRP subunit POP5